MSIFPLTHAAPQFGRKAPMPDSTLGYHEWLQDQQDKVMAAMYYSAYPYGANEEIPAGSKMKKSSLLEYSAEEFRHLSKEPLVKELIPGLVKINKTQAQSRINEYLRITHD